jgi:hypothetical protein
VGPATGGGLVAVTGVGFHDVSSVSLGGSEVASWSAVSPELLEFVVPPGDPGPTDLSIFAAGGFVEAPSAYSYQQQPDAAGDDDDDGGGPTPAGCVAAGAVRPSASGWLAVFVLLGAWRARRGGPPRACA